MSEFMVTKQIPSEKLQSFEMKMVGNEKCAEQLIIINSFKFGVVGGDENSGDGIKGFKITLSSAALPTIVVEYHKTQIRQEVADALGLEKIKRE